MELIDETTLYRSVGAAIKNHRKRLKLTQGYVADRVGITRTSITNIEKGDQKAPLHTLYKLFVVLNLNPHEVLPKMEDVVTNSIQQRETITVGEKTEEVTPRVKEIIEELIR